MDFFELVGKLKTTKRTGWVLNGVHLPEVGIVQLVEVFRIPNRFPVVRPLTKDAIPQSVADHMYRSSLISLVLAKSHERDHAVKLALAHDLAEASVGDITPHCGVSAEEKFKREEAAMANIRDGLLKGNPVGGELYDLWTEYENASTPAAILMKDIDKFEMILNANEYEQAQDVDLSEFFLSTEGKFRTAEVLPLVEELRSRREKRIQSKS